MQTATVTYWWRGRLVDTQIKVRNRDGLETALAGLRELGFRIVAVRLAQQEEFVYA